MIGPKPAPRVVCPAHPVAVELSRLGFLQVPVPHVRVHLGQFVDGLVAGLVEQAQVHRVSALRKHGEVRPGAVPGGTKRVRFTRGHGARHEGSGYRYGRLLSLAPWQAPSPG